MKLSKLVFIHSSGTSHTGAVNSFRGQRWRSLVSDSDSNFIIRHIAVGTYSQDGVLRKKKLFFLIY